MRPVSARLWGGIAGLPVGNCAYSKNRLGRGVTLGKVNEQSQFYKKVKGKILGTSLYERWCSWASSPRDSPGLAGKSRGAPVIEGDVMGLLNARLDPPRKL